MSRALTPSQTVGPFFHDALLRRDALVPAPPRDAQVRIVGTVVDGAGEAVPDAVIEAWQGSCFSRVATDAGGAFEFITDTPLSTREHDAPHIDLVLFARGVLNQLVTRIYFPGERTNDTDPVLQRVPAERRATLIATHDGPAGATYRFDIVLQGRGETVFFDVR